MKWSEAEPVLTATYALLNEKGETSQDEVCQALGRPAGDPETTRALGLLYEGELIGGFTVNQSPAPVRIRSTPKGLRQASGWPTEGGDSAHVDLLLALLDERIESDATPEPEKGKLRRIREDVVGLGRDLAVDVFAAYIARVTGVSGGE